MIINWEFVKQRTFLARLAYVRGKTVRHLLPRVVEECPHCQT